MKIVFMGTPDFSVPVLDRLIAAGHEILCVYTQPPRPAGRGKKERPTPVHARADHYGLQVKYPKTLRDDMQQAEFAALGADLAVVVAYGLILPQAILDLPQYGCLNIHASLLPRWRGAAPIHRAIMAGDRETGISIMQMEAGLDTGPVLLTKSLRIEKNETTAQLHDRLALCGAEAIVKAIAKLPHLPPQPQPSTGVSYAEKIDKSEAEINWTHPAENLDRLIRGLSPFPGAWTTFQETRIKCLGSELVRRQDGGQPAGQVVGTDLEIACGEGVLRITRVQRAGKAAQNVDEFLRGTPLKIGDKLGT